MFQIKTAIASVSIFVLLTLLAFPACVQKKAKSSQISLSQMIVDVPETYNIKDSCIKQIQKLNSFAQKNAANDNLFFIIDLEQHSGKKRFYVFDKKQDSVLVTGMVAQGQGKNISANPVFSNVPGSYCSSRGIYKIGKAYQGRFGLAYKLDGKEFTNSNALSRFVVLHAHDCVPEEEVFPGHICQSQGCPTIAPAFLKIISNYIEQSDKPILLQIM